MPEINLGEKFPELRPIRKLPALWSINGCGFMLYGKRAYDEETGSSLQTHCLCLVFVPVLALAAYRIAWVDGGKYILGREPLSGLAKGFNALVLLAAIGLGGGVVREQYVSSPAYIARHRMAEAGRKERGGEHAEAAHIYAEVARDGPDATKAAALDAIDAMLLPDSPVITAEGQSEVFLVAARLLRDGRWPESSDSLYRRGMALVNHRARSEPEGAWSLLDAAAPLAPRDEDFRGLRNDLLERVVAGRPDDPEWLGRLAAVYEEEGRADDCFALLDPHRDRLGTTEAARILGQFDARSGQFESALALLRPYVEARIERFREADADLARVVEVAQLRVITQLEAGNYGEFDIASYEKADSSSQQAMLGQYIEGRIKADPAILDAQDELVARAGVVPVALDLGVLLLQRAQEQDDPESRAADLEEAEETLLAVGQLAGDQDEYKLNLGQVYYWQGRHGEGRSLFDEVLTSRNRDAETLLAVGGLLRGVGSENEARAVAEEAYAKAETIDLKQRSAILRGLLGTEVDDRIAWLRKGNPTQPWVRALLGGSLADQAFRRGDEEAAIRHLRETVTIYESLPESSGILNNTTLALAHLARLSGDDAEYGRAMSKIERAIALSPSNSLTLMNAASFALESALRDIIGRSIDLTSLGKDAEPPLLRYLYQDEQGRLDYAGRLATHPGIARAEAFYEKVLLLSPRRPDSYQKLAWLRSFRGDLDGLRALRTRLDGIELDVDDQIERVKDLASGRRSEQLRLEFTGFADQVATLLEGRRAQGLDATFTAGARDLLAARLGLSIFGGEVDADALVALADEAHSAAPSVGTRGDLSTALIHRGHERLVASKPAYAALADQVRSIASDRDMLMIALSRDGPARDAVLADPDIGRAAEFLREQAARAPHDVSIGFVWCLLDGIAPEAAEAVARFDREEESERLLHEIQRLADPASVSIALESYWLARMRGREDEGIATLDAFASRVVPLPVGPPRSVESLRDEQGDVAEAAEIEG